MYDNYFLFALSILRFIYIYIYIYMCYFLL